MWLSSPVTTSFLPRNRKGSQAPANTHDRGEMIDELRGNMMAQGVKASPAKVLARGRSCSVSDALCEGFSAFCPPPPPLDLLPSLQQTRDTFHPVTGYFAVCQLSKTRVFSAFIPLLCRAADPRFLSAILKIPMASAVFYSIFKKKIKRARREVTFFPPVFNNYGGFFCGKNLSDLKATSPKSLG